MALPRGALIPCYRWAGLQILGQTRPLRPAVTLGEFAGLANPIRARRRQSAPAVVLLEPEDMRGHGERALAAASEGGGLSQKVLARLLGHAEITVSRQLRGHWETGVPRHVIAAILA